MSHLTSPGPRPGPAPPPAAGLGLGVPGWGHPLVAPAEWGELTRPGTPVHWAVLDVARGPGSCPDPYCAAAVARLRAAGVTVLGRLDVRFGTRPFGEVVADAGRYLDWYRPDGFYLDRCPSERPGLAEVRRIVTTLRALRGRAYTVLGQDTHPYQEYAEIADQLVTFRGRWADYRWSQVAEWTAGYPPERFCHLVHGVPRPHLDEALRIARWQGAGTVFFTDRTARPGQRAGSAALWETLPGHWDDIVSRIGPCVME
ncbi:spherulation-specific family 4 protein [Streptomyces sp. NBRC 110028]|uniref:spherulation-specific family 4 protein n=1 Tax=Streptomyces sp. NBRC 110028 TaxID=1621260 RepID=UPI000AF11BA3